MKKIITRTLSCMFMMAILLSPVFAALPSEPSTKPVDPQPAAVKAAIKEYKGLSRKEKKSRIREAKKVINEYKANKKMGKEEGDVSTVLLVVLAILLPPLAVYLHQGEINSKFWIALVLTILFFVPGVIYALLVVLNAI